MKQYITTTKDTCWRDTLACLLEIDPRYVPDFVKKYGDSYLDETRKWLRERYNKGLIYVPVNAFMETGKVRQNGPIGPDGYSIAYVDMIDEKLAHAVVCFNGGVFWDNGDNRNEEYKHIEGYYIIYDLNGAKVKRKKKSHRRKGRVKAKDTEK